MSDNLDAYSFIYRGMLTQEALDSAGRTKAKTHDMADAEIGGLLSLDTLNEDFVADARGMAIVYTAIAAFENSVRNLVSSTLLENKGANWWTECVSEKIRTAAEKRLEEERKVRWHVQRGDDPIQFTMLPNLLNIIRQNTDCFEPFIPDVEWAASIFDVIEKSRNVIMHSGRLNRRDVARLGTHLRDWSAQITV
ncbi:hypothetical protein [Brevundimonas sp.]|uniref:hypothetical protein n=1 Tax=Brevundimonas sp. TaxID=1871086 RepID=UPI0035664386